MPDQLIERALIGSMLRHQAGRQMWCHACEGLLDARDAVSLELMQRGELVATRMLCADCADDGAVMAARRAGRSKSRTFSMQVIDGRLVDRDDAYHPPEASYGIGPRGAYLTVHDDGPKTVRGIAVFLKVPEAAVAESWFAYRYQKRAWHFVHAASGLSVARAGSLRGCIHGALGKMHGQTGAKLEGLIRKAKRGQALTGSQRRA